MAENEKITSENENLTIEEGHTVENEIEAITKEQGWQLWNSLDQSK